MRRVLHAGIEAILTEELATAWSSALDDWTANGSSGRLWQGDSSLWSGADENRWLGWLQPGTGYDAGTVDDLRADLRGEGVRKLVVLGMGGSSLGVDLLSAAAEPGTLSPEVDILDSIDPDQIRRTEASLDLASTIFVVASKSGSTLETRVLADYFYDRQSRSDARAGRRFIAITDEGSALERQARDRDFRHVFRGVAGIGGRYSVLSPFGLVPLGLCGGDAGAAVAGARAKAAASGAGIAAAESDAVALGVLLGVLYGVGVYRLPIVAPAGLEALGSWIEQLVAESTGKEGRGLLPIVAAAPEAPPPGRSDRVWVGWQSSTGDLESLVVAGESVVLLPSGGRDDIGGEIFRWEMATAVASALLSVHGFVQPDVEASKEITRELISSDDGGDFLPVGNEIESSSSWRLFASPSLKCGGARTIEEVLAAHLGGVGAAEFVALLAWMERSADNLQRLERLRAAVGRATGGDVSLGLGPRYLHSTGQYFKGGPNQGRYLQITCERHTHLDIPGRPYSFAQLEAAQARGDFDALCQRGRRVLQIHLLGDPNEGLDALTDVVARALG